MAEIQKGAPEAALSRWAQARQCPIAASRRAGPSKTLYWSKWLIGVSSSESGLDFFTGGLEYFKIIPLTWQDNEFIPVLTAKPAE